ncbi:MAG: hypothetical protein COV67_14595 [Nitrospinae bacterium CG11_big_fil_rev_8_21_14_0_20_56_8]|nr:MAG: hypothetical protein COV67_14595 [Nitrospinae bacterium CG11_big_fil_rev_8_21_14_0_20_56_8]
MRFVRSFLSLILLCGFASFLFPFEAQGQEDIGEGKLATGAVLTLVDGVAVDREGNIYISHRSKNRIRKIDRNGIITTVAGNGIAGYGGDGGPARQASLNFPAGLAFDSAGNLFVADRNNHRIRRIDRNGIITTAAGNGIPDFEGDEGPAIEASLNFPSDAAFDRQGNLYISDRSNNRVRKVDAQGIITTIAGIGVPGFGGDFRLAVDAALKYPFGICLDKIGNLYIADRGNNRVRKVDAQGIITTIAGDGTHSFAGDYGPAEQSGLAYPTGVAVDDAGNLFIADRNNNRIRKIDPQGVITTFAGTGQTDYNGDNEIGPETNLHLPLMVAVDPVGDRLIVLDRSHFRVRAIGLNNQVVSTVAGSGKSLFKGDGGPGGGATLDSPSGVVVDSKGRVLFADKQHDRIRRIDPNGNIETFAGTGAKGNDGDGGPALQAELYLPSEMTIDDKDNIYVVSRQGNGWIVRKIDSNGIITHFAGNGKQGAEGDGGPAREASFYAITDVAVDRKNNVYIADSVNKSIRKVDSRGIITRVTGEDLKNLAVEVHPNGLAVDAEGNLYISDSGSSRVRKLNARDGTITVFAGTGDFEDFGDEGPALKAGIRSPGGLAIGPEGALYIIEQQSNRIRKVDGAGMIHSVAGTQTPGYSGDGGPATQAQIKDPFRMAFDREGNLYFSDRDNNRIRKIDREGIITTLAGHGNIGWMQDGLEVGITVQNFP